MALYDIKVECFLGVGHCGSVSVDNEGTVELSDDEVKDLVALIKMKGTSDIEKLDLENALPDIYEKLYEAYSEIADDAVDAHWLESGLYDDCYEYDIEELMDYCATNHDFVFECNEKIKGSEYRNAKEAAFNDWLESFLESLSPKELIEFITEQMNGSVEFYGAEPGSYEIKIPEKIVEMAK